MRAMLKAIVFDFDGTLTQNRKGSNCWQEVWKCIDELSYDDFLYQKYARHEIDIKQWFDLVIERFKEKNVELKNLHNIAKTIKLLPGVYQTFKHLYDDGVKIFVLSGGIRQIIDKVLKRAKVDKFITSIQTYDLIFDSHDKLTGYTHPDHNLENKNQYIEQLKQKYNLKNSEILFVGNGANDEAVCLSGVDTLCINPDGTDFSNKNIWHNAIENCENLTQIIKYCDKNG